MRIEIQITDVPAFAADAAAGCTTDLAEAATSGLACNRMRVVTGKYVEAL